MASGLLITGCPSDVDCAAGAPCEDSFALEVIPGGAGFEVGTYHFEISANGSSYGADCYVTGSPDATMCEPIEGEGAIKPTLEMIRDDQQVVTSFEIAIDSAPAEVKVRVTFGNELLAEETFTEYEEIRNDPGCPVRCRVFEDRLTVLP